MRRKDSSFIAFRKRVPADLIGKAEGRSVVIRLPAEGADPESVVMASVGNAEVKFSLRTRDPAIAKSRSGIAEAHLQRLYASLRQGARQLTRREVTALAGEWYRSGMARWEDEPGSRVVWQKLQDAMAKAADDPAFLETEMAPFVHELLAEKALIVDEQSRMALMQGMRRAIADVATTLKRRSEFDYGPDELVARYPAWEEASTSTPTEHPKRPSTTPKDGKAVSMRGLVDGWWQEAQAAGLSRKTHQAYGSAMDRLIEHVGHDDASRITPEDVLGLKDARLAAGVSTKTVKDSDIAGLKGVFRWAVANKRLPSNPADGITVKRAKVVKLRERDFTDAEAKAVLEAALRHEQGRERPKTFAAKRWVPWLCAYTGARVGEIAQLRKQDVRQEGEHWVVTLTPEAGPIKTKEVREIPLHPHLVEMGFPAFVGGSQAGYLFITPVRDGDVIGPLQGLKNRLAEFGRSVVSDPNVSPNHAWRHRFKTVGMDAGVSERVLDAICGHAPRTVGATYGTVTLNAKAAAVRAMPRYEVDDG